MQMQMPQPVFHIDPYVYQTLQTVVGKKLVVDTPRGTVRGLLADVKPDHIVIKAVDSDSTFFIRIQQIIWIMPE
ncbi:hypothetical protein SY83_12580 [Paenibacillus swuensis]|uniref:DUF2642 domain-containing protein n=2 Tax=Paenibacillus swuensis TaxID=1178515 RepID=A0A172TPI5_9BACL|nr:hypothetical protein SY83_12580 [Paenibacillus swuensis]